MLLVTLVFLFVVSASSSAEDQSTEDEDVTAVKRGWKDVGASWGKRGWKDMQVNFLNFFFF